MADNLPTMCGAHLSDMEVATRVRMLMRDDLDHEAVCVMARDRIRHLSAENRHLREALDQVMQIASVVQLLEYARKGIGSKTRPGRAVLSAAAALSAAVPESEG